MFKYWYEGLGRCPITARLPWQAYECNGGVIAALIARR
jgi:hypothetical protein